MKKTFLIFFLTIPLINYSNTESIKNLFYLGGPVMWVLLILSVISTAIIIEKIIIILIGKIKKTKNPNFLKKINKNLDVLKFIANISPLAGFLGTVTGMLNSFKAISELEAITPKIVAKGIFEALITTAFGLIISLTSLLATMFIEKFRDNTNE